MGLKANLTVSNVDCKYTLSKLIENPEPASNNSQIPNGTLKLTTHQHQHKPSIEIFYNSSIYTYLTPSIK